MESFFLRKNFQLSHIFLFSSPFDEIDSIMKLILCTFYTWYDVVDIF